MSCLFFLWGTAILYLGEGPLKMQSENKLWLQKGKVVITEKYRAIMNTDYLWNTCFFFLLSQLLYHNRLGECKCTIIKAQGTIIQYNFCIGFE